MKKPNLITSFFALLFVLYADPLMAGEKHNHGEHESSEKSEHAHHKHDDHKAEREQHGAHEHGVAKLAIVVGDEGVEIMLESPAANVVGFEYMPVGEQDKQRVLDAKAKLEAGDDLFDMSDDAGCELKKTTFGTKKIIIFIRNLIA